MKRSSMASNLCMSSVTSGSLSLPDHLRCSVAICLNKETLKKINKPVLWKEDSGQNIEEMLQRVGGSFMPDFGDMQAMSFSDDEDEKHNTLNFISDMILHTKKNEKVSFIMQRIRVKKIIVEHLLDHNQRHMILKNKNILQAFVNEKLMELIDNKSHLPMVLEHRADRMQSLPREQFELMPKEVVGPLFDNEEFLNEVKKELRRAEIMRKQSDLDFGIEQKTETGQIGEIKEIMKNLNQSQRNIQMNFNSYKSGNAFSGKNQNSISKRNESSLSKQHHHHHHHSKNKRDNLAEKIRSIKNMKGKCQSPSPNKQERFHEFKFTEQRNHIKSFQMKHLHIASSRARSPKHVPKQIKSREIRSISPNLKQKAKKFTDKFKTSFKTKPLRRFQLKSKIFSRERINPIQNNL